MLEIFANIRLVDEHMVEENRKYEIAHNMLNMNKDKHLSWMLLTNNMRKTKSEETNFRIDQRQFNQHRFVRRFQRPSNSHRVSNNSNYITKCCK